MLGFLFVFEGGISVSAFSFHGSACTPCLDMTSPKNWTNVHLIWHLSLLSFRFTCLHICSTLCSVLSCSLPSTSYPTTKMSSAMPETFGKSLNSHLIFFGNYLLQGLLKMAIFCICNLPNWHANIVRYDNFSSSFRLL